MGKKVIITDPTALETRVFEDYTCVVIPIEGKTGEEMIRKTAQEARYIPGITGSPITIEFSTENGITYMRVIRG